MVIFDRYIHILKFAFQPHITHLYSQHSAAYIHVYQFIFTQNDMLLLKVVHREQGQVCVMCTMCILWLKQKLQYSMHTPYKTLEKLNSGASAYVLLRHMTSFYSWSGQWQMSRMTTAIKCS